MLANINSQWVSGNLVFYESGVGQSVTGDVLTIGTTAVTVGNSGQDIDFKVFLGAADQYVLFDAGAAKVTFAKVDVEIDGDLTLDLEDIQLGDNQYLQFGDATGGDVSARWVSATSLLQVLPAADDTGAIHIGDGTTDIDFRVFLGTSGKYVDFNVGDSNVVLSAGVSLSIDDTTASTNTTSGSIHTDGGLGVAGATYLGTILGLNSAASDIVLIANTAAALEFYDATTKFLVADTRNTVTGIDMLTMTGIPATIAGASGVTRRILNIVPGTTTLTGSTGVTDMTGIGLYVTAPTLTDSSAITVAEASTVEIAAAPIAAGSVTITKGLALKVASGKSMFAGNVDFGIDDTGVDVTFFGATTAYKVWFDQDGDTNGAWYFGADTKGVQVNLYGDVTGCGVFWDPTTDTNGTLIIGGSGGSKGNDVFMYGATNGNYLQWDQSADDLLLVGTATQLAVAGTTEAVSTTTGSLRTAGGLACVGDFYAGDDIFLTSGAILNFAAGEATFTHQAGNTQGKIKFDVPLSAPAMDDGYGAFEFNTNITGVASGWVAGLSSWLNITGTGAIGGQRACAQTNGIYGDAGSNTGSTLIVGMRMQAQLDATDFSRLCYFDLNTGTTVVTALFNVGMPGTEVSWTADSTEDGAKLGAIPFMIDNNGVIYYMRLYATAS